MARDMRGRASARHRSALQKVAVVIAAVFVVVGVLGFVPGVTTHLDELAFAGHYSEAKLFGLFQVSVLHNLLHLLFGVLGLVLARRVAGARLFLVGGGAVYLVLWLYGFAIDEEYEALNFIPLNNADNFLHMFLGFGMLVLGLLLSTKARTGGSLDTPLDRP